MKKLIHLTVPVLVLLAGLHPAAAQGTMFTYQGHFNDGGAPANGSYDLEFSLFKVSVGDSAVAGPLTNSSVAVSNGLFTTTIDFGPGIFDGTAFWLEIGVRSNGAGAAFTVLSPRQPVTPAPYAVYAAASPLPDNAVTSAKILNATITGADLANNTVNSAQLADNVNLGDGVNDGILHVYNTSAGGPAISLYGIGTGGYQYLYQDNGQPGIFLDGDSGGGGLQALYAADASVAIVLDGDNSGAGLMSVNNNLGQNRVTIDGEGNNSGGQINLLAADGGNGILLYGDSGGGGLQYLYAADGSIGIALDGDSGGAGLISIRNTNSVSKILLDGAGTGSGGQVSLFAQDGSTTVVIYGEDAGAGLITVNNSTSSPRVVLDGQGNSSGGQISVRAADGADGIVLYGDSGGGGLQYLYTADLSIGIALDGESGGAGYLAVYNTNTATRVAIDGFNSSTGSGEISVFSATGTETIEILGGESLTTGGQILMRNASGVSTIQLDSDASGVGSGYIRLYKGDGTATVTIEADNAGDGRITTQELSITGGSDLSEQFDIQGTAEAITPGALVCIDPQNPGKLRLSSKAYDRTVAGVISGAGGVKTGMMMGQRGSLADGKHAVALTGRVFCMVDADQGTVQPGDLITTSDVAGHGMKVTDHVGAHGAIIGKAMTGLEKGKGLVLVLVSLQ